PQIDRIYERRVELQSGGSIVIDATEALTAIDVNSGRSTRAATQEETALHTNLEAADEVARQLRLRDVGGLIVVDFIDMRASKNQRRVEKAVKDALKADKARSTVGRISPNGLLEINRQRIQQALQLRTHRSCPTCNGSGRLASEEMVSLSILRRIEARAASGAIQGVKISLHPELADALQNHYRQELAGIEEELDVKIEIIATAGMHRPEERIEWQKREKPARVTKPPKPTPVILQAWDLALPEDEEDYEDDLLEAGPAKAQTRDAGEPGAGGDEAAARKRKRRRGGRKRKKKGPGENGGVESAGETGSESGGENGDIALEHDDSEAFAIAFGGQPRAVITRPAEPAERFDGDGDGDDEGPDDDFDDGPEDAAEGTEGVEGA